MRLNRLETWLNAGTERVWRANVDIGQTTLVVGRNATGKSRILASIRSLAHLIAGRKRFPEANFKVEFADGTKHLRYEIEYSLDVVHRETFRVDGEEMLNRGASGSGWLRAKQVQTLNFEIPKGAIAAVAKRDRSQHEYLEPLHEWADALRYYRFNDFKRETFGLFHESLGKEPDPSDYEQAIGLYHSAVKRLPNFKSTVIEDMNRIGFRIDDVGLDEHPGLKLQSPGLSQPVAFFVKEADLKGKTYQLEMSDGMFRSLALIIHSAYAELASVPSCMVVDDIGEGLDYERSTSLIRLLMGRADRKAIQLIMSTNDRFAMNAVPLEVWCGLRRTPEGVETVTVRSHPDLFEQFKLTGLNNFDFFKTDFFEAMPANG